MNTSWHGKQKEDLLPQSGYSSTLILGAIIFWSNFAIILLPLVRHFESQKPNNNDIQCLRLFSLWQTITVINNKNQIEQHTPKAIKKIGLPVVYIHYSSMNYKEGDKINQWVKSKTRQTNTKKRLLSLDLIKSLLPICYFNLFLSAMLLLSSSSPSLCL